MKGLKEMESTDIYNMTGYTFLSKPRTNKRGGGGLECSFQMG